MDARTVRAVDFKRFYNLRFVKIRTGAYSVFLNSDSIVPSESYGTLIRCS